MDIEKLIERLRTESLYADKASLEIMDLCMDAATALSTLQAANEKLWAELEQVTRERDAAIGDIYSGNANDCDTCLHGCDYNNDCPLETGGECKYKWRGLQREN